MCSVISNNDYNPIQSGRNYIYDVYSNDPKISNAAVDKFRNLTKEFEGGVALGHEYTMYVPGQPMSKAGFKYANFPTQGFNENQARRNHTIYKIDTFAQMLFEKDEEKIEAVKTYLYHKVMGNMTPQEFQDKNEPVNEQKLSKFMNKLADGKFQRLSKAGCEADREKDKQIEKVQEEIEDLKDCVKDKKEDIKKNRNELQDLQKQVKDAITIIDNRIERGINNQNTLAAMEKVLKDLKNINEPLKKGKDVGTIPLPQLSKDSLNKTKNCLSDKKFEQVQHTSTQLQKQAELKQSIGYLEELEKRLEEKQEELARLQGTSDGKGKEIAKDKENEKAAEINSKKEKKPASEKKRWYQRMFSFAPVKNFFSKVLDWFKNLAWWR